MAKPGEETGGRKSAPSLATLFETMWSWVQRNLHIAAAAVGGTFLLAVFVTLLIPRDYVATMVVTPVESSLTDPSALMTLPGFSIRSPFSLANGPPPQMAAFIKLLKSPEAARNLAGNPQAMQYIDDASTSWLGAVKHFVFGGGSPGKDSQVDKVQQWLMGHITVDQDLDVQTWTISLRYPTQDGATYLLTQVHATAEGILRTAAMDQFNKEKKYGLSFLNGTIDAQEKQIIYGILDMIDRSLLVLRSGANVATTVISSPYAPNGPSYPSRMLTFLIVMGSMTFILFAALVAHCYRAILRGHGVHLELAPAAANP